MHAHPCYVTLRYVTIRYAHPCPQPAHARISKRAHTPGWPCAAEHQHQQHDHDHAQRDDCATNGCNTLQVGHHLRGNESPGCSGPQPIQQWAWPWQGLPGHAQTRGVHDALASWMHAAMQDPSQRLLIGPLFLWSWLQLAANPHAAHEHRAPAGARLRTQAVLTTAVVLMEGTGSRSIAWMAPVQEQTRVEDGDPSCARAITSRRSNRVAVNPVA